MIKAIRFFYGTVSLFFLFSCIPEIIPQEALLDTPSWHYNNGMKLLQAGKVDASYNEFSRALEMNREYAPGYVGLGLAAGLKGDYPDALEKIAVANSYTRNRQETVMVHVGRMRVYIMGREKITRNWLDNVEKDYERSILLASDFPEPYFVMGLAYKISWMHDRALEQFLKVVEMNKEFVQEASEQILEIQSKGANH